MEKHEILLHPEAYHDIEESYPESDQGRAPGRIRYGTI